MIAYGVNSICCRFSSLEISQVNSWVHKLFYFVLPIYYPCLIIRVSCVAPQVEKAKVELFLRSRLSKCTVFFLQNATRSTIFTAKARKKNYVHLFFPNIWVCLNQCSFVCISNFLFNIQAPKVPHVKCSLNHGGELLSNSKAVGKYATSLSIFRNSSSINI